MPRSLLLLVAAAAVYAAMIRGVVVDYHSGRPLARTVVVLQPVAGGNAKQQSVRTDVYGDFEFQPLKSEERRIGR